MACELEIPEAASGFGARLGVGPALSSQIIRDVLEMNAKLLVDILRDLTTRSPWKSEAFPNAGRPIVGHVVCSTLKSAST